MSASPSARSSTTRPDQRTLSTAIRPWGERRGYEFAVVVEVAGLVGVDESEVHDAVVREARRVSTAGVDHEVDAVVDPPPWTQWRRAMAVHSSETSQQSRRPPSEGPWRWPVTSSR